LTSSTEFKIFAGDGSKHPLFPVADFMTLKIAPMPPPISAPTGPAIEPVKIFVFTVSLSYCSPV
jgi:hypothetical protein